MKLRLQIAKKRHDQHFLFNLNLAHRNPNDFAKLPPDSKRVCEMVPPRRKWTRPRLQTRSKLSSDRVAQIGILNAIKAFRTSGVKPRWLDTLDEFVAQTQKRAFAARRLNFEEPTLVLKIKDKTKKTFRPIATFSLDDQVIIGLAADHLRETIDSLLRPASFAFRCKQSGSNRAPQHHDAVDALRTYILKHRANSIYVAECDIQKFFDTVNHAVAMDELKKLLKASLRAGRYYDRRLLSIFKAYLRAYNYPKCVDRKAPMKLNDMSITGGSVPWVKKELQTYYASDIPDGIGVPQGGALSPIIANIVLHAADLAVERKADALNATDYFYARYCDDMVIASPDEYITSELFAAYTSELQRLKLPFHAPTKITKFSSDFFECKTKDVYHLGSPRHGGHAPWIAFLGYHVRYDGKMRIRKSSIQKEMEKQRSLYLSILKSITRRNEQMRVGPKQAHYRAKMRMIAMSVGRAGIDKHGPSHDHEMCWVTGFELLKRHPHVKAQLRSLDRMRSQLLADLKRKLHKSKIPNLERNTLLKQVARYHGRPFSYFDQFNN